MTFVDIPEGLVWPPPAKPLSGPLSTVTQTVFTGKALLMGWNASGGGSAGAFSIYDGLDATGQLVGSFDVAAGGSVCPWYGDHGIYMERGVTVVTTAALSSLVLFVAALWRPGNR